MDKREALDRIQKVEGWGGAVAFTRAAGVVREGEGGLVRGGGVGLYRTACCVGGPELYIEARSWNKAFRALVAAAEAGE